jgi:hypothetical protein
MNKPKKTTENSGGWKGTRRETDQKYLAFNLLIEQGISITKAAELMGYSPTYGYNLAKKIRDRGQKLSIVSEQNTRTAHRVVKRLMAAKTWGDMREVKDSTVLRAAEVVLDRAEPKNQDQAPPSISMTQYNLNMVRPGHPSP